MHSASPAQCHASSSIPACLNIERVQHKIRTVIPAHIDVSCFACTAVTASFPLAAASTQNNPGYQEGPAQVQASLHQGMHQCNICYHTTVGVNCVVVVSIHTPPKTSQHGQDLDVYTHLPDRFQQDRFVRQSARLARRAHCLAINLCCTTTGFPSCNYLTASFCCTATAPGPLCDNRL